MHLKRIFLILTFSFWSGPIVAEADELIEQYDNYKALTEEGKFTKAVRPASTTSPNFAENNAGTMEAEPLYKRSLLIVEKSLGAKHLDVARILNNLATLYVLQGRHHEAEPLYKRAMAIKEKVLGPDDVNFAMTLSSLA